MNPENEKQDQLVAALVHLSVLVPFIGLAVPLTIWISRKNDSPRLGFQSLQALIYQSLGAAGYILYFLFSTAIGVASIPISFGLTGLIERQSVNGLGLGEFLIVIFMLLMGALILIGLVVQCIVWPAYLGLGLWAALKNLQGKEFQYPILGAFLSRRVARMPVLQPVAST